MAELSDAEVFGMTPAPQAAPRELSDAEVFGTQSAEGMPTRTPSWGVPAFLRRDPNAPPEPPLPVIRDPENPFTVETRLRLPEAVNTDLLSVGGMRKALEPEPGYVPTGVLPFSLRETTPGSGEADPTSGLAGMRWDWGPVRMVVNPLLDLLEGTGQATSVGGPNAPLAGKVSPEATMLLLGAKAGNLNPFQARNRLMAPGADLQFGAPEARPPSAGDLRAAPLSPEFTANPLSVEARAAATTQADAPTTPTGIPVTPPTPGPPATIPPSAESGPRSVGAAASRDMTDPAVLSAKTPAQALNDFRTSVTQTVRDRSQPGATPGTVEDHTVYVPGVTRLESARVFDPEIAGNHDAMKDIDPGYKTAADAIEQRNHDVLKETFLQQAGDTNSIDALREAQRQVSPEALGVFQNERPVSAQPILDTIREIMASPAGKVEAVQNVMRKVEKGLYDADGNLEVLPSQIYGARRNLTSVLNAKGLTSEASDAATARHELNTVLPVMDRVIGQGADGFSDVYLPQWAAYAREIDQQSYLQGKTLGAGKVTGADGNLTANGIQKLLEQIAVDKGKPGNNPAKTLTDQRLDNLIAIRNELAAMQFRDNLAKSSGSPTVKKATAAARLGKPVLGHARDVAAHAVLVPTGGIGNAIYQFGVKPGLDARAERAREAKAQAIMSTTRNRLLSTSIPTE
jgi:hypothetical protein